MTAPTVEVVAGLMTITLVDVDNRNPLSAALVGGIRAGLAAAKEDPAIRAVVITNDGPVFCAGADLKAGPGQERPGGRFEDLLVDLRTSPTPVFGRIAGHAFGGGMGLAAALDVSIAIEDARFGFPEVRLGVAPAIISVVCLPKMRRADAVEAFLRGNRFPAARAAEMGLINRAVPADRLDAEVADVVADIRKGGPAALAAAKQLIHDVPPMSEGEAVVWTARFSADLFKSEEAAEGIAAFMSPNCCTVWTVVTPCRPTIHRSLPRRAKPACAAAPVSWAMFSMTKDSVLEPVRRHTPRLVQTMQEP